MTQDELAKEWSDLIVSLPISNLKKLEIVNLHNDIIHDILKQIVDQIVETRREIDANTKI